MRFWPKRWAALGVVSIGVLGLSVLGCSGGSPTTPSQVGEALSERAETRNFVFHFAPGDRVDSDWQEQYFRWLSGELGVGLPRKIHYFKYRSRAELGRLTGEQTNAFAVPEQYEVHTIWPGDDHETVHVLVGSQIGHTVGLFSEGIAVAHQVDPVGGRMWPMWSNEHVHTLARRFRRGGTLIALADLLTTSDFVRVDPDVRYPESGSFVRYLIDEYGLDTMLRLVGEVDKDAGAARVRDGFRGVFGISIDRAEEDWHAMLDVWQGP